MFKGLKKLTYIQSQILYCPFIEEIGDSIFEDCENLIYVASSFRNGRWSIDSFKNIPNALEKLSIQVKKIGKNFFKNCKKLQTIPSGGYFYNTSLNMAFEIRSHSQNAIIYNPDYYSQYFPNANDFFSWRYKKNITELGDSTFEGCESLQFVGYNLFSDTFIDNIPKNTFKGCKSLTSLNYAFHSMLNPLTIEEGTFSDCIQLTDIARAFEDTLLFSAPHFPNSPLADATSAFRDPFYYVRFEYHKAYFLGGELPKIPNLDITNLFNPEICNKPLTCPLMTFQSSNYHVIGKNEQGQDILETQTRTRPNGSTFEQPINYCCMWTGTMPLNYWYGEDSTDYNGIYTHNAPVIESLAGCLITDNIEAVPKPSMVLYFTRLYPEDYTWSLSNEASLRYLGCYDISDFYK